MGVIGDDDEFPRLVFEHFHAAFGAGVFQAVRDHGVGHAQPAAQQNGRHGVLHVERTRDADGEREHSLPFPVLQRKDSAAVFPAHVFRPEVRVRIAFGRIRDDAALRILRRGADALQTVGIEIQKDVAALAEKLQFRGDIILFVRVLALAHVVQSVIQESADVEFHTVGPVVFQSLRRHLHDESRQSRRLRVPEVFVQRQRLRRRQMRLELLDPVVGIDRGQETDALAVLRVPGVQHALDEVQRRGFALGAGQADQRKAAVLRSVKQFRHQSHGAPDVAHEDRRMLPCVAHLRHVAERSCLEGFLQILGLKRFAFAHEKRPRRRRIRIVGQVLHIHIFCTRIRNVKSCLFHQVYILANDMYHIYSFYRIVLSSVSICP